MRKITNSSTFSPTISVKKNQRRFPEFFSRKIVWITLGIAIVLVSILISQNNPLSKKGSFAQSLPRWNQDKDGIIVGEGVTQSGQNESDIATSGHNLQIGPISLSNSSYVTSALDEFVKEQDQVNSTADTSVDDQSLAQNFSIQEIVQNPIKYLEGVGYDTKISFLNNNRKTTLIKLIDSLSRYYISYNKFPELPAGQDYGDYSWIEEMVNKNEVSGVYQYLIKTTEPVAYCGTAAQTGYCYSTNEQDAIIYVRVEKPFESDVCGMEGGLFLLWSSRDNRFGNVCMSQEPDKFEGFDYFIIH